MSFNTFGRAFRFTTWGESHGPALGCVVDGCPPGVPLSEADIQPWLDRRRPGLALLVAHALFKSTLFLVVGVIDRQLSTRDIGELSGVGRQAPTLAAFSIVAVASIDPVMGGVDR